MKNSHIEWTDHTFNPWIGCTKVSPACMNCYAWAMNRRFSDGVNWGKGAPRLRTSVHNWNEPRRWSKQAHEADIAATAKTWEPGATVRSAPYPLPRPRVFCASLADWLDDEVPIEWLADLLRLIHETPNIDWLLLTKRPQNWDKRVGAACSWMSPLGPYAETKRWLFKWLGGLERENHTSPANVWIGTTVEDRQRADERIPLLLQIPAKVRFLSCEPLLGPLDIEEYLEDQCDGGYVLGSAPIHWVICGGESGPQARPMNPDWARSLRDQCAAAGVPFFFKQWGELLPWEFDEQQFNAVLESQNGKSLWHDDAPRDPLNLPKGWEWSHDENDIPTLILHQRVGKKEAGRLLDGKEHSEFPSA